MQAAYGNRPHPWFRNPVVLAIQLLNASAFVLGLAAGNALIWTLGLTGLLVSAGSAIAERKLQGMAEPQPGLARFIVYFLMFVCILPIAIAAMFAIWRFFPGAFGSDAR